MIGRIATSTMILGVFFAPLLHAQDRPTYTFDDLCQRTFHELEQIYRAADAGAKPQGFLRGHVVFRECDFLAGPRSKVANFLWLGKHVCGDDVVNQWRGIRMIRAEVSEGTSWLDGRPAHILDYQHTSWSWRDVRDEAREVAPGIYVGAMHLRRCPEARLKVFFVLETSGCR